MIVSREIPRYPFSAAPLGLLRKQAAEADLDFLREAVVVLAEALMEAEVSAQIGAEYEERSPGTVELQIPKLREGSYFLLPGAT